MRTRQCQYVYSNGKQCSKPANMAGYCTRHFRPEKVERDVEAAHDE